MINELMELVVGSTGALALILGEAEGEDEEPR
jgi:hypothetical protein